MSNAINSLHHGQQYPFDAPDEWWNSDEPAPLSDDWAVNAARGVIADLRDRRGIKQPLQISEIDEDVRVEIIQTLAEIIRKALKGSPQ